MISYSRFETGKNHNIGLASFLRILDAIGLEVKLSGDDVYGSFNKRLRARKKTNAGVPVPL